jgi:hypothetical protein
MRGRTEPSAGRALLDCLISPNVADRNLEPANVVDVIDRVADAIDALSRGTHRIAAALERMATCVEGQAGSRTGGDGDGMGPAR